MATTKNSQPQRIKSITQFHRVRGLPGPAHPLISVIDFADIRQGSVNPTMVLDFFSIAMKRNVSGKFRYGQQEYDFDEGVLFFIAPGQVFSVSSIKDQPPKHSGWLLLLHPDFFWNTSLTRKIRQYEYFDYTVHEALFLSDKEEAVMNQVIRNISDELHANIDKHSQTIVIAQIELLLAYGERFYQRQFITRKISNHQVLDHLEKLLDDHFNNDELSSKGLPTAQYLADHLNLSLTYLSTLLRSLTGQNTQQHIHEKLISKAKEKLTNTDLTVSEIAYELGFGHPQSFCKFFKNKTKLSPLKFRRSFN
ncbi:MAG: AraC family transcriptional regulator [Citrobacter freundii]|nr:MAG: AraC family transcriptional regulator [Citrobacter freundii]